MSHTCMAFQAPCSIVMVPTSAITSWAVGVSRKAIRANKKIPAATIVAAWIRAETGVGPSMASGNQTCSGICADLPVAPMNMRATTHGTHVGTAEGSVARAKSMALGALFVELVAGVVQRRFAE